MIIGFDTRSMADYRKFIRLRSLPSYSWRGEYAVVADQYASLIGEDRIETAHAEYCPHASAFDYQRDISAMAIRKRKFAVFADCGLGKTLILLEFAKHAAMATGKRVLIVSPLMVIPQTIGEAKRFYGEDFVIEAIPASAVQGWLVGHDDDGGAQIGITNYEAIRDGLPQGMLGALILDESSMLKSHYGKWGTRLIRLGRGLDWKLCCTGTPAPNDRIEYANHAVFLDHFRTTNEFLARYFVNRGETQNRWEIKPHALRPFYRDLSHWCLFLTNPAVYGWKDNCESIPPIHIHINHVPLTKAQRKCVQDMTGKLLVSNVGGIGDRGKLAQIAKGRFRGKAVETNKPQFIRNMIDSWPDESTLIWCRYNAEQDTMESTFPESSSIRGETEYGDRCRMVDSFKAGDCRILISKPKILGFGLNLQIATRQVFSGLQDSYEEFYQAVKRSNRVGSTKPLNVHIPVTEIEEPMVQTVLDKAHRVQQDTEEQERLFQEMRIDAAN